MKLFIVAVLVAAAVAVEVYPSKPVYSKEAYPTAAPAYKAYEKTYDYPAMPHSFEWAVDDQPSYNHYSHSQNSDGKTTSGSYKVLLPDGRTQIVTYKDEGYGLVADVKYDGYAAEYKPAAYPTKSYTPEYKPAAYPAKPYTPEYKPAAYPAKPYVAPAYPIEH